MKCPRCGRDDHIHRSRRRTGGQRLLSALLLIRPYRCHHCNHRFWRSKFQAYKHDRSLPARTGRKRRRGSRGAAATGGNGNGDGTAR